MFSIAVRELTFLANSSKQWQFSAWHTVPCRVQAGLFLLLWYISWSLACYEIIIPVVI